MPQTDEQKIVVPDVDWQEDAPVQEPINEEHREPNLICEWDDGFPSPCEGWPFYKAHEGKRYCVLHYPSTEKDRDFQIAFEQKREDNDSYVSGTWRGVWFPEDIEFSYMEFETGADFRYAKFSGEAKFDHTIFKDYIKFAGSQEIQPFTKTSLLDLQTSFIEKPERVSFHSVTLRPHWFINTDTRKFEFTNVKWTSNFDKKLPDVNSELEALAQRSVQSPHRLLTIACRRLAVNAEENNRYEEASYFRFLAMQAQRLEKGRGWAIWTLRWWYWLASGYGERIVRASVVLFCVWFIFTLLYTQVGFTRWEAKITNENEVEAMQRDTIGHPLPFTRALTYSFETIALQKPEPRPATNTARALVTFETILGPLQAALLALAIRRKFMR
ncbi:MAG: hypothetical protein AB1757_07990 [Acidobacteriota bacterium]